MKTTSQKLTEWAIEKIKKEFIDDVALLVAVEENSVNNDGHSECFDYFIPSTEKGFQLAQTFIIDGIGHDLYPRTWKRMEKTATLDDKFTNGLAKAKILYSRSDEDTAKFIELQQILSDNLNNPLFMYKKALEEIDEAMNLFRTMVFENELYKVRMATGYVANYLSTAIAYMNGTYLGDWQKGNICILSGLKKKPSEYIEYLKDMLNADNLDDLKRLAYAMIASVRKSAEDNSPSKSDQINSQNYQNLADWYQELSLIWRRIAYYCDINNAENAFEDACYLQNELMVVKEEFNLAEMDLLSCFKAADLSLLRNKSVEIENYILSVFEKHNISLKKYNTVDEFISAN